HPEQPVHVTGVMRAVCVAKEVGDDNSQ
ncbi:MAG: hypothetical protein RLZ09_2519, partial [Pseudomonadota bacterium]